jgi:hypothetical protein
MRKELFERAEVKLRTGLVECAEFMTSIVMNDKVDAKTRIDAAKWVFERVMGKNPERLDVNVDSPFFDLLDKMSRIPDPGPAGTPNVVDGVVAGDDRY